VKNLLFGTSINFDVSSDSYQFDPVMFCQFHQGLMAFPGEFGIYLQTVTGLDNCLTVRKKVYVSTSVSFSWILHYTSLNGIYISLEYCGVELNTETVPPSQAPSVHPQLHCLDLFWICLYTRPGPVFVWVEPFFAIHAGQGTRLIMACGIHIFVTSCQTPSVRWVRASHTEIFWCDQS